MKNTLTVLSLLAGAFVLDFGVAVASENFQDVRIAVPKSRMQASQVPERSRNKKTTALLFGVSSWMPRAVSFPVYADGRDHALARDQFSTLFLEAGVPLLDAKHYLLSLRTGLRFTPLERSAEIVEATGSRVGTQTVSVFSAVVGMEVRPEKLSWPKGSVHLGANLVPSVGFVRKSLLSDEMSSFGVPVEFISGVFFSLYDSTISSVGLDLSVSHLTGASREIDFSGNALRAALQIFL